MTQAVDANVTRSLAEFVASTGARDLPGEVLNEARRLTLDVIGNIIGGTQSHLGQVTRRFLEMSDTRGPVGVIGTDFRRSAEIAAYAHGRCGDALDASDTFMSVHHLGVPVISAALSLAEVLDVSGTAFLTAVAVGMEVGARLGAAEGPSLRATAPTAGLPPNVSTNRLPVEELAASAAAAKIMGLDAAQIGHTLGICGANAPRHAVHWGVTEVLPEQKYQDYGIVAQTGVTAALLAASGLTSHPDALGGPSGLWRLCGAPGCDFELMLKELGRRWFFISNTYKPWPSCRWTHCALTAFERLRDENRLSAAEIDRIIIDSHVFGVAQYFRNQAPRGMVSCEFNYPHALAMLALRVPPGPWWYSPGTLDDPEVAAFRCRVDVRAEPYTQTTRASVVDGQLRELPTRVTVLVRGREMTAEAEFARGDPISDRTRFTDEDLFEKFLHMGSAQGSSDRPWSARAERIGEIVRQLDHLPSVRLLTTLLTREALALPKDLSDEPDAALGSARSVVGRENSNELAVRLDWARIGEVP